eukprot:5898169-Lingulodinium_polyedra.AAC.1
MLDGLGLVRWRRDAVVSIGVFFVLKKYQYHLRMILDARRSNCYFSSPPKVELLTSEGLGRQLLPPARGAGMDVGLLCVPLAERQGGGPSRRR